MQLPEFSCPSFLGLRNCKLVFLISKVSQYGGSKQWFQLFPTYSCKPWNKIDTSIRRVTFKFGKQVHLENLAQMRLIKQVLVALHVKITWQSKNIISPLPWLRGLARLCEKLNLLYLPYHNVYGHKTGYDGHFPWAASTHKVVWLYNRALARSCDKLNSLYIIRDISKRVDL